LQAFLAKPPVLKSSEFSLFLPHEAKRKVSILSASCFSTMNFARELRSEEHTSELQSPYDLVCRLLLEKKKKKTRQKRKQQTPPTLRLSATHRHLIITTTYRAPTNRVSLLPPPRTPLQSHTTKYTQDTP